MLVTTKEMFEKSMKEGYAIGAFNVNNMEIIQGIMDAAAESKSPVILQASSSAIKYARIGYLVKMVEAAVEEHPEVPVAIHLDHGPDFETAKMCIDNGFTSVMIDASFKPFEENVALTKQVVEYAHAHGVTVEAEIGHVGTGETYGSENNDSVYTEVDMAVKFVELTNVDSLAVSIGTAHGKYKGTPVINFERLHQLREAVKVPLVLHGGSGSGEDNLRRCSTEGISKINIFTDFISAASDAVAANENIKNWFDLLHTADEGIKKTLRYYYNLFDVNK